MSNSRKPANILGTFNAHADVLGRVRVTMYWDGQCRARLNSRIEMVDDGLEPIGKGDSPEEAMVNLWSQIVVTPQQAIRGTFSRSFHIHSEDDYGDAVRKTFFWNDQSNAGFTQKA